MYVFGNIFGNYVIKVISNTWRVKGDDCIRVEQTGLNINCFSITFIVLELVELGNWVSFDWFSTSCGV